MLMAKTSIPTAAQYKRAFVAIQPKMRKKHREMLNANYAAPRHTISVDDLAKAVGQKKAFLEYGRLGKLICDELGFTPTMKDHGKPVATHVLADAPNHRSQQSWEWTLRPQVVQALEELGWVRQSDQSRTFILIWNPKKWRKWTRRAYKKEVEQTTVGKLFPGIWSCGNTKSIKPGDRLFLLRVDSERGLIASATAISTPYFGPHWDGTPGRKALYVKHLTDALVDVEDRFPMQQLLKERLSVHWNRMQKSGIEVPKESAARLVELWQLHLVRLGRSVAIESLPQDETTVENDGNEGVTRTLRQIVQRRGQPAFREQLLDAYGCTCAVTGCNAKAALEAAHIEPYSGPSSNCVSNGLLLRSDIHTLFDLGLIAISPDKLTVAIDLELVGTQYDDIAGQALRLPRSARHRPDSASLGRRWKEFKKRIR